MSKQGLMLQFTLSKNSIE